MNKQLVLKTLASFTTALGEEAGVEQGKAVLAGAGTAEANYAMGKASGLLRAASIVSAMILIIDEEVS